MTVIKSETRETYTVPGQPTVTVIEPRWELTPMPMPPLEIEFARNWVIRSSISRVEALEALGRSGKTNGDDLQQEYQRAEDMNVRAVSFLRMVERMAIAEEMEALDDGNRCCYCGTRGGQCSH